MWFQLPSCSESLGQTQILTSLVVLLAKSDKGAMGQNTSGLDFGKRM